VAERSPAAALYVPRGHGLREAAGVSAGQKKPAGHAVGTLLPTGQ
jgi:hypothetical protein